MSDKVVPLFHEKKTARRDVILDPKGFFVIEVVKGAEIRVEYFSNVYKGQQIVSGVLEKVFIGVSAAALCDTIALEVSELRHEHYMYLGRELQKAEWALKKGIRYEQGGC